MSSNFSTGPGVFTTTHWSLVQRAGQTLEESRRAALGELVSRYLPALRLYLLNRHHVDVNQADDFLQGFLLSKVLESGLLSRADPQRGRFRGFLCRALDHYVVSEFRRDGAKKRSPKSAVSVEEAFAVPDPALPPDEAFDVAWAQELLSQVLGRMRAECDSSKRPDIWGVFDARLLGPMLNHTEPPPFEQLVEKFGFASAAQASNVLITARRMFVRLLRAFIGEYESEEAAIDKEIAELMEIVSRSPSHGRTQLP